MSSKPSPSYLLSEIGDLLAKREEIDTQLDKLTERLLPAVPDECLRFIAVGYSYTRRVLQIQRSGDILDIVLVTAADDADLAFSPEPEPEPESKSRPTIEVGGGDFPGDGAEAAEFGPGAGLSLHELEAETA